MTWQTIDTAPKHVVLTNRQHSYGPRLLLYPFYGEIVRGRWWDAGEGYCNWLADGGQAFNPTHWMPLPDPPKEAA